MKKKLKFFLNTALALTLTLSLVAGAVVFSDRSVAAAEFKYASPFSKVGKSTYLHNGRYTGNLIVNGVDISDWQSKKCDFNKAKAAGVDYAIMRVTYTSTSRTKKFTTNLDSNFAVQFQNAKESGMMRGVYVFSQAKNKSEGVKEAQYAIKRLKALGIGPEDLNLPVYMDYEFSAGIFGRLYGLTKSNATSAAIGFCDTIRAAGYQPGIYANTTFFKKTLDVSKLAGDIDLWCAQYYSRCESSVNYSKWQYSSSARIDGLLSYTGLKGNIDADFWYLNKDVHESGNIRICGKSTLSVSDAKFPSFRIYDGSTLLKEGTDYNVGGIRNNAKGSGYAYIKGLGKYSGYALVPITIAAKTKGSADDPLDSVAANYLTSGKASSQQAQSSSETKSSTDSTAAQTATDAAAAKADTAKTAETTKPKYKKGSTYKVQTALNIRKGPGTKYARVKRSSLSKSMKKKTVKGTYAVLKKGAKVKCTKVKGSWIKISGGWVCCYLGDEVYLK